MISRSASYDCTRSGGVPAQLAPPAYQFVGSWPDSTDWPDGLGCAHAIAAHDKRSAAHAGRTRAAGGARARNFILRWAWSALPFGIRAHGEAERHARGGLDG